MVFARFEVFLILISSPFFSVKFLCVFRSLLLTAEVENVVVKIALFALLILVLNPLCALVGFLRRQNPVGWQVWFCKVCFVWVVILSAIFSCFVLFRVLLNLDYQVVCVCVTQEFFNRKKMKLDFRDVKPQLLTAALRNALFGEDWRWINFEARMKFLQEKILQYAFR